MGGFPEVRLAPRAGLAAVVICVDWPELLVDDQVIILPTLSSSLLANLSPPWLITDGLGGKQLAYIEPSREP